MDENRIEALGSTPVESTLTAIRAATTHEQLGRLMGHSEFDFEGTFFGISIDADPNAGNYPAFGWFFGANPRQLPLSRRD
jgi:predicted metalloendopeptidase